MKRKLQIIGLCLSVCLTAFSQKVFMTGDSHVSGKVYPNEVKRIIEEARPDATFTYWGKGGAGFYTFNDTPEYMQKIYDAKPDVLVVHLGTNGSYHKAFDEGKTLKDVETFHTLIRDSLPDCMVVYVTPFYNKNRSVISGKGKNKRYGEWKLNEKTRACADVIIDFAKEQPNTYVIDNNADAGTIFLDEPGLINVDYVHLTRPGYELLGQQVAEKLLEMSWLWNDNEDQ